MVRYMNEGTVIKTAMENIIAHPSVPKSYLREGLIADKNK